MHPAPLPAYPSSVGSPNVDLQPKKKRGRPRKDAGAQLILLFQKKILGPPFHNAPNVAGLFVQTVQRLRKTGILPSSLAGAFPFLAILADSAIERTAMPSRRFPNKSLAMPGMLIHDAQPVQQCHPCCL